MSYVGKEQQHVGLCSALTSIDQGGMPPPPHLLHITRGVNFRGFLRAGSGGHIVTPNPYATDSILRMMCL